LSSIEPISQLRNPKSEYRNPKQARISKIQIPQTFCFQHFIFGLLNCFEFRLPAEQVLWQAGISCFEFSR